MIFWLETERGPKNQSGNYIYRNGPYAELAHALAAVPLIVTEAHIEVGISVRFLKEARDD